MSTLLLNTFGHKFGLHLWRDEALLLILELRK